MRVKAVILHASFVFLPPLAADEPPQAIEVSFSCPAATAAGTLLVPHAHEKLPCVVIIGGSMSHTRDGALVGRPAPPRDALKRLAEELAREGYASLRYDRAGHGASHRGPAWKDTYADEAALAAAALQFTRKRPEVSKVIAAGESAGGYLACLAARDGAHADGYLFLGALCGPVEELYEHNFGRLVSYADASPVHLAWATRSLRRELALGRSYKKMLAAAAAGERSVELSDGDFRETIGLERRAEELRWPPDEMFRHVKAPSLAIAGERDANVPPPHAARIAAILKKAGNADASSALIPGADHSFQETPNDEDLRVRERYSFESFRRPYAPRVYEEIIAWLEKRFPSPAAPHAHEPAEAKEPPRVVAGAEINRRAAAAPELDPATETTPERLQLAPGIEIIDDVTDRSKTAGVETLEGRIGPLLLAEGCQAHFIDMPGGLYLKEHPHSTESIIFTVRGQWVLCSQGRRHLMKPGSLFRFGTNVSTGYEVPFKESAYILIFKGDRTTRVEKEFIDYLKGMAASLAKEHAEGVPYLLKELPPDHPARKFAGEVNPKFEEEVGK